MPEKLVEQGRQQRVVFELDDQDWHGHATEGLWVEVVEGADPPRFRLLNSPFFARGVSYLDVISVTWSQKYAELVFASVVERSGHSTYMILVPYEGFSLFLANEWPPFERLNCSFEGSAIQTSMGDMKLLSIDVQPAAGVHEVFDLLNKGEERGAFMFQEGHVGHQIQK